VPEILDEGDRGLDRPAEGNPVRQSADGLWTTFDRADFTRIFIEKFGVPAATVERFFTDLRAMNYYDHNPETTGQMFERYFPGRDDVQRLLMEPIAYANGSTLEDPAISFGIVFSNFMGAGVYTSRAARMSSSPR